MGRYSLWVDPFADVEKYELEYLKLSKKEQKEESVKSKYPMCHRFCFRVDGKEKETFSIPEIDSLVARCQRESQLLIALASEKYQAYSNINKNSHLIATYKAKGKLFELPLVYHSPLLAQYAYIERDKEKRKDKTSVLNESPELDKFVGSLLKLAQEEDTKDYIFQTSTSPNMTELSRTERKKLKTYLPKDREFRNRDNYHHEYTVGTALENYARTYAIRKQNIHWNISNINDDMELVEAQKDVFKAVRKDYKTLRQTILFYQTVQDIIVRKRKKDASVEEQMSFYTDPNREEYIEDLETREDLRDYFQEEEDNKDLLEQYAKEKEMERKKKYPDFNSSLSELLKEEEVRANQNAYSDGFGFEEVEHYVEETPSKTSKR